MSADEAAWDGARRNREALLRGEYGPEALDEVTTPPADEWREAQERDIQDPADVEVDAETLRDGGPSRNRGTVTTTGGTAGPANVRRRPRPAGAGKVAPTTTGDATSGGMRSPKGGSTSDASGTASQVGNFTRR